MYDGGHRDNGRHKAPQGQVSFDTVFSNNKNYII